jgi:hypothetical protein
MHNFHNFNIVFSMVLLFSGFSFLCMWWSLNIYCVDYMGYLIQLLSKLILEVH